MRRFFYILGGLAVLAANTAGAAEPSLTAKELADARKIYVAKCAKCHELYDPKAYKEAEWSEWMTKMGKKSKLKAEQVQLLVRYTDTLRSASGPPSQAEKK